MFWKIKSRGNKKVSDNSTCPYHGRVESLEEAVKGINETCCSTVNMEQRVKTNILLEQLIVQVDTLKDEFKKSEEKNKIQYNSLIDEIKEDQAELREVQEVYKKYFHYAIGAIAVLYFFGVDKKIKALLGGG